MQTLRIIWQYMGAMSGIMVCIWFSLCSNLNYEHVWSVTSLSFLNGFVVVAIIDLARKHFLGVFLAFLLMISCAPNLKSPVTH